MEFPTPEALDAAVADGGWHPRGGASSDVRSAVRAALAVDEQRIRDEQTRRIVEVLRGHGPVGYAPDIPTTYGAYFAEVVEREFAHHDQEDQPHE